MEKPVAQATTFRTVATSIFFLNSFSFSRQTKNMDQFTCTVHKATDNSQVNKSVKELLFLRLDKVSCGPSGAYNLEVASTFLFFENLWTPDLKFLSGPR
jgi:hypothetical protein